MPHPPITSRKKLRAVDREEGAVLIVVLMMLLSISATAVYAVSNATSELRGASAMRSSYQAEALAVAAVEGTLVWADRLGASGLRAALNAGQAVRGGEATAASNTSAGAALLDLSGAEPVGLALGELAGRFGPESQMSLTLYPANVDGLNRTTPSTVNAFTDIYDVRQLTTPTAGSRSDGYGMTTYVQATYTGRAVIELANASSLDATVADAHRAMAYARAVATIGPSVGPN